MVPSDIDRGAPAVVSIERLILALPDRLWRLQTGVGEWPSWQADIAQTTLDGPFAVGNHFTWSTAGLTEPIVSTIYRVEPGRSILWGGPSAGIIGIHHWQFEPAGGGTLVTTEESWSGAPIDGNPAEARKMLAASLERWLDYLVDAAAAA